MMTWINIHNPSEIVACSWYSQGVDIEGERGRKSTNVCGKIFLLKFLILQQMMTILINTKRTAKNTTITERQIDMLNASISRVAELAGQEFEAVKSLAINDSDLNPKKHLKNIVLMIMVLFLNCLRSG